MKSPKNGMVFETKMNGERYMSLMDKHSKQVRCLTTRGGLASIGLSSIAKVFTPEESQAMLHDFFPARGK